MAVVVADTGESFLVAANSAEARQIAGREPGIIHLLLTDLITRE